MKIKNLALTLCASLLLTSMSGIAKEVKIGMAIDDLRLERWQKDRDIFVPKSLYNLQMAMKKRKCRRLRT